MSRPDQRRCPRAVGMATALAAVVAATFPDAPDARAAGRPPRSGPDPPRGEWKVAAQVPLRLVARLRTTGCGNDSIPEVAIDGRVEVGALGARFLFHRGDAGPSRAAAPSPPDAEGEVEVLPAGTSIAIPPQLVRAVPADTLFYFLQLEDARGRPLSDPVLAGRCVDGLATREVAGLLPVEVEARVRTGGCGDRQGTRVALTGTVRLAGVWARITFRGTADPLVSPPAAAASGVSRDVSLLAPGRTTPIPGPPAFGVAGGNPVIDGQLTLGSGIAAGPAVRFGKCSELAR